jgi:hypothetical protein
MLNALYATPPAARTSKRRIIAKAIPNNSFRLLIETILASPGAATLLYWTFFDPLAAGAI